MKSITVISLHICPEKASVSIFLDITKSKMKLKKAINTIMYTVIDNALQ